ncbi:hypothetical protein B484DRAFT_441271 [Ochromonadaceae sp. CCMP2298]|nr:hypothetical protein B484DRAFT_441271 [Ochromonadaceae sp. CCMP2298]
MEGPVHGGLHTARADGSVSAERESRPLHHSCPARSAHQHNPGAALHPPHQARPPQPLDVYPPREERPDGQWHAAQREVRWTMHCLRPSRLTQRHPHGIT